MPKIKCLKVVHSLEVGGVETLVLGMAQSMRDEIDLVVCCLDGIGVLGYKLEAEGIKVYCVERKEGFDLGVPFKMSKIIKREGINIIHAHQYTPFFYGVLTKLLNPWTKLVFTEHGRHFPDIVGSGRKCFNKIFQGVVNRITAVCEFSKRALVENDGFDAGKIQIVPNGIDVVNFRAAKESKQVRLDIGLKADDFVVGYVGRLHPEKNPQLIIKALPQILKVNKNVKALIVGDGELRSELVNLGKELNVSERTLFLGERYDIPDLLGAMDVFVMPSRSEAASVTILEAMAVGKPVIATNVGGNPELVEDKKTGVLIDDNSGSALADAVKMLFAEKKRAKKLGKNGKTRVNTMYSTALMIKRYLNIYKDLINL